MSDIQPDVSRMIDRRMALAREWDELVNHVREIEGFEDFLRPPRIATLMPAAACGPIAMINVSALRCDALVVTTDDVQIVELGRLSLDAVRRHTASYLNVLQEAERAALAAYEARRRYDNGDHSPEAIHQYSAANARLSAALHAREETLRVVLEWLWDDIADPVLTFLGHHDTPAPGQPWPRLWWCPTGPLTLLPIHAAGYHTTADGSPPRTVLDRVVSSYTPTLRALLEATRFTSADSSDDRMLIVALPEAPGQIPLDDVVRERDLLVNLFADRHTLLEGEAATWEAVRAHLPHHRWVHFSCHGDQDLSEPSRGRLLLHDRPLTIAEVSAGRYHGDFVFLSACKTATGGLALPDEAITLAASLHYTGYRHVIGTLWSVYDETAADVAEIVYEDLTSTGQFEPSRAAHALHTAIRKVRDMANADGASVPPSAWIPFTHTGP